MINYGKPEKDILDLIKEIEDKEIKDKERKDQFVKRFRADYNQEAMEQDVFFNDEKDIPLIDMMQMIIKDVIIDEIDMTFVKKLLKLEKEKIESMISQEPECFAEIVALAVDVELEKMLGYFGEIGLSDKFVTIFELREKAQYLNRRWEDLYDDNTSYHGSYASDINECGNQIEELENKEKEIFENLKNDAWTLDEIRAGHKIDPVGSFISR